MLEEEKLSLPIKEALREIGGKTHTFWFDWGPAGKPVVVGVWSLAQKPLPYKVNGIFEVIVFSLRKSVLLDVDVFCIRWLLFYFASTFRKKKERKRSKYRSLWQLNFYPGHHCSIPWPSPLEDFRYFSCNSKECKKEFNASAYRYMH